MRFRAEVQPGHRLRNPVDPFPVATFDDPGQSTIRHHPDTIRQGQRLARSPLTSTTPACTGALSNNRHTSSAAAMSSPRSAAWQRSARVSGENSRFSTSSSRVSTAVSSLKIRMLLYRYKSLRISTCCFSPHGKGGNLGFGPCRYRYEGPSRCKKTPPYDR